MSELARAIATPGFDPYGDVGILGLEKVGRAIGGAAKAVGGAVVRGAKAIAPQVQKYLPAVQQSLKSSGPWGMAAAGALGALAAGIRGKNLEEIAWSAAEGAAPTGIDRAIAVANRLRRGDNVLQVALDSAARELVPGSSAASGFGVARAVLEGRGGRLGLQGDTKRQLAGARRMLPGEEARRAFDAAVGTVSRAAKREKKRRPAWARKAAARASRAGAAAARARARAKAKRAAPAWAKAAAARASRGAAASAARAAAARAAAREAAQERRGMSRPDPLAARRRPGPMNVFLPTQSAVQRALMRNPALAAKSPFTLGRQLGVTPHTVSDVLRRTRHVLPFRPLSRRAASFVQSRSPFASFRSLFGGDTRGLENGGTVYVVESGDSLWKISQKLVGDGNRYRELMRANPNYPKNSAGTNFKNVWAGMRLKLPSSWVQQAEPSSPAPTSQAEAPASVLQAKALLATWSKTAGAAEAGVTDYGARAEDLSTDWGARDRLLLSSFSDWSNRTRGTDLSTDGTLTAGHTAELRDWAEQAATQVVTTPGVMPEPEAAPEPEPEVIQMPPMVITGTAPEPAEPTEPPPEPQAPVAELPPRVPEPSVPSEPPPEPPVQVRPVSKVQPKADDDGLAVLAGLGAVAAMLFA